jgi:hypothetical protein
MTSVTVQCSTCSLRLADTDHPDVTYERDGNGNILCPNDRTPMLPIGAGATMAAEDAFKAANRELVSDAPMPPAETTETLTKRLQEIERARNRVMEAQDRYETKKDAAKEAKKHYDTEVETFLTVVGRLSAVPGALPLFTQEAEAAAAAAQDGDDYIIEPEYTRAEGLYERLVEAGYLAATIETIDAWSEEQQNQAGTWAAVGTEDTLPEFMRELAEQNQAEHAAATTTA